MVVENEVWMVVWISVSCEADSWFVIQGPCSKFPDCNGYCMKIGFKSGGKCLEPGKGAPLACACFAPWFISILFAYNFRVMTNYLNWKSSKAEFCYN